MKDAHLTKRALHTFCAVNEARLRQPVGGGHCFVGRLNTKAVHDVLRVEKKGCEKGKLSEVVRRNLLAATRLSSIVP